MCAVCCIFAYVVEDDDDSSRQCHRHTVIKDDDAQHEAVASLTLMFESDAWLSNAHVRSRADYEKSTVFKVVHSRRLTIYGQSRPTASPVADPPACAIRRGQSGVTQNGAG